MSAMLATQDNIAIVTMDDGKANAINPPMLESLHAAFDEAEAGAADAVILTGRPGRFSAGFDLNYFQTQGAEATRELVMNGGKLAHRLYGFKKPLIAAVNGHAIAMGCFLTQSCDYRIGTSGDFKIGANETAISMVLPEFALQLLRARVRPDRLTEAAVIARLFAPDEAVEVGYLDRVVEGDVLMETAMATAKALGELPSGAYLGNKTLIRRETLAAIEASF